MAKTILVVEDEPGIRKMLVRALAKSGYLPLQAENGREALSLIQAHPPDMVLLDLIMPKLGGMSVCEKLRQNPATCHIPIIMVTGKNDPQDQANGLLGGADDYIVKPFSLKELNARVTSLFRRCGIKKA